MFPHCLRRLACTCATPWASPWSSSNCPSRIRGDAFAALAGLAAPKLVQFGSTSLQDLYRDLYGVEGT